MTDRILAIDPPARRIEFRVYGDPKGQPRARAFKMGDKVRVYDPATAEGWKAQIAEAAKNVLPEKPIEGPVEVCCRFYFKRPKSHYRTGKRSGELRDDAPAYHTIKPDRDNLDKAVLDALTALGMWKDDSQACVGWVGKYYVGAFIDSRPGALITVRPL